MIDCGTAEEGGPVARETAVVQLEAPGHEEPVTHSDAPLAASGPTAGLAAGTPLAQNKRLFKSGNARPRANRRRADATGESGGRIRAKMAGTGLAPGPGGAKAARVEGGLQEGNMA